jgi:hypothetical protein
MVYDHELAMPTAAVMVKLSIMGATAYCQAIMRAIPSLEPLPLNSTIIITLLAVGVRKTIRITK